MCRSRRFLVVGVVASALLVAGCASRRTADAPAEPVQEPRFVPLFEPNDPSDRIQVLDSRWVVEGGTFLARQDPRGRLEGESWLLSRRNYRDFVLRLKFRITPGGNSGVFLRDPLPREERLAAPDGGKPPPWEAGYEVNINNDEPNYPTGSIWATAKGPPGLQNEGEWNALEVRLEGDRIWTRVNGKTAIDGALLPPRAAEGAIGFQRHGGAAYRDKLIEFKDVEILELGR